MKKLFVFILCLMLISGCVPVPVGPSLRRQGGAAALLAAGGGDEQGEAQLPLRPADDGPGFRIGHAHGQRGLADGMILLHPMEEHGDARSENFSSSMIRGETTKRISFMSPYLQVYISIQQTGGLGKSGSIDGRIGPCYT